MKLYSFLFLAAGLLALGLVWLPRPAQAVGLGGTCSDQNPCDSDQGLICYQGTCQNDYDIYRENPELKYIPGFGSTWQMPPIVQTQQEALSQEAVSSTGYLTRQVHDLTVIGGFMASGVVPGVTTVADGGGAIGSFGNLIAGMTSESPVKTTEYIADLGQSLGFVTPAYAQDQGTGFRALEPVLPLWKAFRNLAYFGFVIIFVVIGFMIMFRTQINPQTVISVQAALPKIVVTLLLITFSYAIAALVVDLIYLLIYLMIGAFGAFGILNGSEGMETARNLLLGKTIFGIALQDLIWPGGLGAADQGAGAAALAVHQIVQDVFEDLGGAIVGLIGQGLAYVIFAVAILIAVFKLFFQLLLAYIGIIFSVIFAPVTLLFNALPGNNGFFNWLKGILANALIFPVTAMMLLVAGALLGSQRFGVTQGIGYDPQSQGFASTQLPLIGGGVDANAIPALIGIGFIMMMPKVIEMVQKMMGIEGGFAGMAGGALEGLKAAPTMYKGFRERQTEADQMQVSRIQLGSSRKPRIGSKLRRWGIF